MVEQADTQHLKCCGGNSVPVQVWLAAPTIMKGEDTMVELILVIIFYIMYKYYEMKSQM